MLYEVEEIGFDTFVQTECELIDTARFHCTSYDERKYYLPIDTVERAIKYLTENGFKVREIADKGDIGGYGGNK